MRSRAAHLFVLFTVLVIGAAGCNQGAPNTNGDSAADGSDSARLHCVATVGMVADLVQRVGGDQVRVSRIMGAGVDPHLYKPSRDDVALILSADLVFYSGLLLEGRMTDALERVSHNKPVVAVTAGIPSSSLLQPEGVTGHFDPHVWMDVIAWSHTADVIAEKLSEQRPAGAADFKANAALLRQELQDLNEYARTCIHSIPPAGRVLITSHDAFSYFGRAYGLEVVGVQGLSTDSEAGLQRINELVDLLVERRVAAVFVESSVPQKNMQALIDGARSRGHSVRIGGELFSDAMGGDGTYEGTYVGMLDHNVTTVTRALGGTAPERGFRGLLNAPQAGR